MRGHSLAPTIPAGRRIPWHPMASLARNRPPHVHGAPSSPAARNPGPVRAPRRPPRPGRRTALRTRIREPWASSAAAGSGVVTTGTPRAMYSTTLVGIECRKFGSSCSSDRPASAPSSIGMAWSFGTNPCQRSRPSACAGSICARARASAGADQFHRDAVRAEQPGQLDHLRGAAVRGQVPDVHHPPAVVRRGRDVRHVGGVRHHRMRPAEPRDVPVLGQDQVHVPLGHPLRGVHGHGRGRPERARQPGLGAQRGGRVLVHIPDHAAAACAAKAAREAVRGRG